MTAHSGPTAEQIEVAKQPANARVLVTAEAGSGKTFTLVRRLEALVQEERQVAADILVLSFSRAAVREIRGRLAKYGEAARHVDVRTFDSYTTFILSELDPDGAWLTASFDERVREAIRLLDEDPSAASLVDEVEHLIVDEVQDLVGVRAELVKAILERLPGGFTLLGDPAQGIYAFQLENPEERLRGSGALYSWLRGRYGDELIELTLAENMRARSSDALVARPFGPLLCSEEPDYATIHYDLMTTLRSTGALGTVTEAAPLLAAYTTPTAILTHTNAEALLASRELHRLDVPHRLQRSAQDHVVPAWVAGLFRHSSFGPVSYDDIAASLELSGIATRDAWSLVKRMDGRSREDTLNLMTVRDRLAQAAVPDELTVQSGSEIVVSTVHRAKGLEFDQVVVASPRETPDDPIAVAEGARALYVAMTRSRDLLLHVRQVHALSQGWTRKHKTGRCVEYGYRRGGPPRHIGLEVQGNDVDRMRPAGTDGFSGDARELQEYLAERVSHGTPVSLVRMDNVSPSRPPRYAVRHGAVDIGVTSEQFSLALKAVLGSPPHWPIRIDDVRVDCVETVVGSQGAGENAGLGPSGVWLRPRIEGLGRLVWTQRSDK